MRQLSLTFVYMLTMLFGIIGVLCFVKAVYDVTMGQGNMTGIWFMVSVVYTYSAFHFGKVFTVME